MQNDTHSIELRKKIAIELRPQLSNLLHYLDKRGYTGWEKCCTVYSIDQIGRQFEKGQLREEDQQKIIEIFYSFDLDLQKQLADAIMNLK
jgi:hypothetical protein